MMIFQILFAIFVICAILVAFKKKKEGFLSLRGLFFWLFFWILALVAVLYPGATTVIANYLGIGRGTDLVVYASLAVMFFVLFVFHIKLEKINRDVTRVVRKDALEKSQCNK